MAVFVVDVCLFGLLCVVMLFRCHLLLVFMCYCSMSFVLGDSFSFVVVFCWKCCAWCALFVVCRLLCGGSCVLVVVG